MPIIGLTRWPVWRRWFGGRAERAAAKFLRRLGYRVLARNVVLPPGELDLVALDCRTIVFVEVRSTECADATRPAESVDAAKKRKQEQKRQDRLDRSAARSDAAPEQPTPATGLINSARQIRRSRRCCRRVRTAT